MALLQAIELRREYEKGSVHALADVSLTAGVGEMLAVMGPSGCGKSTLLTVLGGLNPPTAGKLLVDGLDVYGMSGERRATFRREYVGFVFQQLQLLPFLNALENVMLPLAVAGLPAAEKRHAARSALARVGLADKAGRLPGQLSGGEQGRVAVARAIVNRPPLVLADEPTGSLDSQTGRQIMSLLRSLADDGLAVILVTHNPENVAYADRVVQMRDGRVEACLRASEFQIVSARNC